MDLEDVVLEIREVRQQVRVIQEELTRYRGFAGGVMWGVSAMAAALGFVWGTLMKHGN